MNSKGANFKTIAAGIIFSILWPSASTATKIGLEYAQPFVVFILRFFLAGVIMLFTAHIVMRKPLPPSRDFKKLAVYGLLNVTIYLGLYVFAMQYVSAGVGSLFIATNPVFISIISAVWLKKPVKPPVILSLLICSAGILIAAYPLLHISYITPLGLILLLAAMLSYSISVLYFSRQNWNGLDILTINGWQTILGGLFLLPALMLTYEKSKNHFHSSLLSAILWLAIPVSIAAVQLWLYLLKDNPVKASFWLFLCPVFGFIMAAIIMNEPISSYTYAGVTLVLAGLYLVLKNKTA